MLFNSIEFAIFLIVVFYTYWALHRHVKAQNILLVVASWCFYGFWDWRFLGLLILTSVTTYVAGIHINNSTKRRAKIWLLTNIFINLAILGVFKYYNFFIENFVNLFGIFGVKLNYTTLNIILPLGISFYTFQAIGYTIDVYKKRVQASREIWTFLAFIAFFPQLISGPIERASSMLPQLQNRRIFNYANAVTGLRQILWGLLKKVVVADTCAHFTDIMFENPEYYAGMSLIVAMILFTVQIYADFSGYSDIAVGTGRLFGIKLTQNFRVPLFSRSIGELWKRWNITLMTWFRDYIYIPLGGSKCGKARHCLNIIIVFLISGIWHGAEWGFIVWGLANALCILPEVFLSDRRSLPAVARLKDIPLIVVTFALTVLFFTVFRCETIGNTVDFFSNISLDGGLWEYPTGKTPFLFIIPMIITEWCTRSHDFALERMPGSAVIRFTIYFILIILLIYGNSFGSVPYLYFQF